MHLVRELLKRHLIPVINHENDTYTQLARHAAAATTAILKREAAFYVTASTKPNAYSFKIDQEYVITMTDTLLRTIETSLRDLLGDPSIVNFFKESFGVEYTPGNLPGCLTTGLKPNSVRHLVGKEPWPTIFYQVFDNATKFVMLHEIAHIKHKHLDDNSFEENDASKDFYSRVADTADLLTYGGKGQNRFQRTRERIADREAGCWQMQGVFNLLRVDFGDQITLRELGSQYAYAWFGILTAVLYTSRTPAGDDSEYEFDHLSFDARLESVSEGASPVLTEFLGVAIEGNLMRVITLLRKTIETIVFGQPSKYMISIGSA
jgi:Peptidase family M48